MGSSFVHIVGMRRAFDLAGWLYRAAQRVEGIAQVKEGCSVDCLRTSCMPSSLFAHACWFSQDPCPRSLSRALHQQTAAHPSGT